MTRSIRTAAALALAAGLAACGNGSAPTAGLLLSQPSAIAAYRGLTTKHADLHPYLAVANPASNDLTIVDAVDDSVVPAPVPLRSLVIPVADGPTLLASASLGDGEADLLVAVPAGGSALQVIRTWSSVGEVAFEVPLGADVLALVAVPSDAGSARVAAALSGGQLAVATFTRGGDGTAIVGPAEAPRIALGFQPVALAAMPDDPALPGVQALVYAATLDDIDGTLGVAEIDVSGDPAGWASTIRALDAGAPTRLVAAARLMDRPGSAVRDQTAFDGRPTERRVYAVLDPSGCGAAAPIACGLVALDVAAGRLVEDPFPETPEADLAPIPIPGAARALAAVPPPAVAPPGADPIYAGTYMRVQTGDPTAGGLRATTGVAAVAATDGGVRFVDLGRWELPSDQVVHANVTARVSSPQGRVTTAAGTAPVDQWLVLFDPRTATTVAHANASALAAAVELTPGYTPTETWTVTYQGALPGLSSRRAHAPESGVLALQVPAPAGGFTEVVRLYDPTLGVAVGDTVVVEAPSLPGCATTFEADVSALLAPAAGFPGGAVQLGKKADSAHPEWDVCVDALAAGAANLRATFLAGGYVLVKGTDAAAVHVGRPAPGARFELRWEDEGPLASACTLPPAKPWPGTGACDAVTCRPACEKLVRVRMARRIGYVTETCGTDARCLERWPTLPNVSAPALGLTIALENPALPPPRGLTLSIETRDGRVPFRVSPQAGTEIDPRGIAVLDRSPLASPTAAAAGVRVLVPYASGVVLDATPTVKGGDPKTLR